MWKAIWDTLWTSIKDVIRQLREGDVQTLASSLSFVTVISIVPLLAVSLSVFRAFGGMELLITRLEPFLMQNLVGSAGNGITHAIEAAIQRVHSGTLGATGVIGLFLTSTKLFLDVEQAVQKVWQVRESRPIVKRLLVHWTVMFAGPLLLAAVLGFIGTYGFGLFAALPKRSLTFVLTFFAFAMIYKLVPNRHVDFRPALWSAVAAAGGVIVAQNIYAFCTKKILSYNKVYGSLASIPIFLLWILVLWWICLAGVALSASWQRRRDEYTRPIGIIQS